RLRIGRGDRFRHPRDPALALVGDVEQLLPRFLAAHGRKKQRCRSPCNRAAQKREKDSQSRVSTLVHHCSFSSPFVAPFTFCPRAASSAVVSCLAFTAAASTGPTAAPRREATRTAVRMRRMLCPTPSREPKND